VFAAAVGQPEIVCGTRCFQHRPSRTRTFTHDPGTIGRKVGFGDKVERCTCSAALEHQICAVFRGHLFGLAIENGVHGAAQCQLPHQEKPTSENYLQSLEISFLLSKDGQLEEIWENIPKFPWFSEYA
jgi:hypothetical protein